MCASVCTPKSNTSYHRVNSVNISRNTYPYAVIVSFLFFLISMHVGIPKSRKGTDTGRVCASQRTTNTQRSEGVWKRKCFLSDFLHHLLPLSDAFLRLTIILICRADKACRMILPSRRIYTNSCRAHTWRHRLHIYLLTHTFACSHTLNLFRWRGWTPHRAPWDAS